MNVVRPDRLPPAAAIRLLATDYDGTLADRGVVAASTWAAIGRWRDSGRRVVLVTGRDRDDLAATCDRLDLFDGVVAENGGWLGGPGGRDGRPLATRPPDSFVEALRAAGVGPIAVGQVVVATWQPHGATVAAVIRESGLPLRVIANKRALMILPEGVDKASGLRAALADLGVDAGAVAGIGDAENDAALLDACGLAVAVANALPALQARADLVTRGEQGAGVSEWIDATLARSPGE